MFLAIIELCGSVLILAKGAHAVYENIKKVREEWKKKHNQESES